ncbi:MAG: hypothetical protein AB3N63_08135 [Puniceicoccaceae bacterium]
MAEFYMILGFLMAAYAIVGNDSIQTLGTFLYSNSHRRWWVLWIFSSTVMVGTILYGWFNYNQDPSYSRLNKVYDKSVPVEEVQEAVEYAKLAVSADPVQERILAELDALDEQLVETKAIFVKDPKNAAGAIAEFDVIFSSLKAELERGDVPNAQRVAVKSVVDKTTVVRELFDTRRDVSTFINWTHLIPPLALLILTRYGFPVSTSFLVLITFQPAVLTIMLKKSLMGYAVAMISAIIVYTVVMRTLENRWRKEGEEGIKPYWVVFQWCSTAFLWTMWLIQDMANIFVYLPRMPGLNWLIFAIIWMVAVQAFIYYTHGGKIQKVVTSKTNTHDIRSATIVDLVYGVVLYYFKILNDVPMSTTWVFLGLLAGREIAFAISRDKKRSFKHAFSLARKDMVKAGFGLGVSVAIAFVINYV